MADKTRMGLFNKFTVSRTDMRDAEGEKHDGCEYFVLDLTHDRYAVDAILAYAAACSEKYPRLAADLRQKAHERLLAHAANAR